MTSPSFRKKETTPLAVVAKTSRIVCKLVDRITGDRSDHPLLLALACQEALHLQSIHSHVLYGNASWIEILENQSPIWAICGDENPHFWCLTQYDEVVDLSLSVAHKRKTRKPTAMKPLYSPPNLWCQEVPVFTRYFPEGAAEFEPIQPKDEKWLQTIFSELQTHFKESAPDEDDQNLEFIDEPIICAGRKLLDDTLSTFKNFDRALSVNGLPPNPFSGEA